MILARAPNHLGDGVMALPALAALAPTVIHAPRHLFPLYRHLGTVVEPSRCRADTAVLFPPSFSSAWLARDARRRIGISSDARGWLLTDVVRGEEHRRDTYAALVRAAGADPTAAPVYPERGTAASVPRDHIGLNPLTRGGPPRTWVGFLGLARRLRRPVVFYGGPGEERALRPFAELGTVVTGLSLPDLASTLQRCALFVSGDTGPAHFARAVGVKTLVLYQSTVPERTGPSGAMSVFGPRVSCAPCYRNRCDRDLGCADLSIERVLAALP